MKDLNYKLIVSDFDGTLLGSDEGVSQKNKEAISEYINAGGIFVISTGRLPAAILPHVEKLGLKGLVCCCNGTIILDIETKKVIFDKRLSLDTTLKACRTMEDMGLHILAFDMYDYYANAKGGVLDIYQNAAKTTAEIVEGCKLSLFLEQKQMAAYKLIALVEPKDNELVFNKLKDAGLCDCDITKSMDFIVEVVNNKLSKGTSVEYLAKTYGIPMEKTIAIGDNYNDMSMICCAGLGVAVANAEESLKEKADYVCEYTNEQSAVASIIEKYGFA